MAITAHILDTVTTSSTEYSLIGQATYNAATTNSGTDGVYQLFLDLSDMDVGEEVQVRIYEKVGSGSTQRIVYQANLAVSNAVENQLWATPALVLMHAWDMTVDAIAGTADIGYLIWRVS